MDSQHKILICSVLFSYILNSRKIHWSFVFFLSFPLDATSKNNDKLFFFFSLEENFGNFFTQAYLHACCHVSKTLTNIS